MTPTMVTKLKTGANTRGRKIVTGNGVAGSGQEDLHSHAHPSKLIQTPPYFASEYGAAYLCESLE